jgi:hypothetical protein
VIALPADLDQHRLKVGADLGEDMLQFLNRLAVEHTAAVLSDEDQMDVHGKDAVSTVPNVLVWSGVGMETSAFRPMVS